MVQDIRVWTGSAWESIKGADGAPGPTAVSADAGNVAKLGADGRISVQPADMDSRWVNVTGDNMTGALNINGSPAITQVTGDARYVNITGDTMTGTLSVRAPTGSASYIQVIGDNNSCACSWDAYGTAAAPFLSFKKFRGTVAAPTAALTGDSLSTIQVVTANAAASQIVAGQIRTLVAADPVTGQAGVKTRMEFGVNNGLSYVTPFQITDAGVAVFSTGSDAAVSRMAATAIVSGASKTAIGIGVDVNGGTVQNIGLQIGTMTGAVNPYGIVSFTTANSVFSGGMSLGSFNTLTGNRKLDVTGDAVVRGILETTGNITSTGTAHSFQPNSITASAIAGLPAASNAAPLADAGTAVVGVSTAYARADHVHPLAQQCNLYTVGKVLDATDTGKRIVNVSAVAGETVNFFLPGDDVMPVGSQVEIYDGSAVSTTGVGVQAGVSMRWNSSLTSGGGAGSISGGPGPGLLNMANPVSRIVAIKVAANSWMLFA